MCRHCEGDFESYIDDDDTIAYLNYSNASWWMTVRDEFGGYDIMTVHVDFCPWCGRELE